MSIPFFDAHLHLRDHRLWPHYSCFLKAMMDVGIYQGIDCTSHPIEWTRTPILPKGFTLHQAFGIHPWYADQATSTNLHHLETLLLNNPKAFIGEIGLDGLRPTTPKTKEQQRMALTAQLNLAVTYQRPIILHGARAWQDLFDTLLPFIEHLPSLLFHGVAFSPECLQHPLFKHINKFSFSINMGLLNPNAKTLRRLLPLLPQERIYIESDAPDFLPRKAEPLLPSTKLNHPKHLKTLHQALHQLLKP